MSEQLRESVSALVDGEATELELRRMLSPDQSATVVEVWSRHQRVRSLLQREDQRFADLDISTRVMAALEDQPALKRRQAWWKPAGGVAVAASVAALVVFGLAPTDSNPSANNVLPQFVTNNPVYPLQPATNRGNVAVSALGQLNLPVQPVAVDEDAAMQARMDHLLVRHTERAALNNSEGLISFARVVSFDAQ